jgi:hypothetical protein
MLDSHYYRHESKVVAVTKETEKTISPDKVTEMYDAVREQALKDIVASLRVEENILNGIVVQFADAYDTASSKIYTRFILNGEEHIDHHEISTREALDNSRLYRELDQHYTRVVQRVLFRDVAQHFTQAFAPRLTKNLV